MAYDLSSDSLDLASLTRPQRLWLTNQAGEKTEWGVLNLMDGERVHVQHQIKS
jgi:hypothetical protein